MTTTATCRVPGTLENGVLFGEDGQLFLADGGHDVLNFALRKRSVSEESISHFIGNLLFRRQFIEKRGVSYTHLIFPDKQSVMTEDFPYPDPACLGETYLEAAPAVADLILYPRDLLRSAPSAVFQKTDTHLNDLGTALVAGCVLDRIFGRSHASEIEAVIKQINVPMEWVGDLGRRFTPHLSEIRQTYQTATPIRWFHNELSGGNNGLVDVVFNEAACYQKRLLIFGDSFGRELARFLSLFIKEVVFLRTPFFHPEMFEQIGPDIVVSDNIERYFSFCASDDTRPPFLMYPFVNGGSYSPTKEFAKALSAVISYPRKPYHDFLAEIGQSRPA